MSCRLWVETLGAMRTSGRTGLLGDRQFSPKSDPAFRLQMGVREASEIEISQGSRWEAYVVHAEMGGTDEKAAFESYIVIPGWAVQEAAFDSVQLTADDSGLTLTINGRRQRQPWLPARP